ncbi:uncharacterized protein LOC110733162 [Chenopodium quinoa]|uniref:uncharacterized protein LOC110733162 n=1 Tax=Chenopodium quinoa TaxID=63459 RepID=UPI000B76D632|nr:uncharacterized protein LOC110733162 [Chenopodium quinoa]
MPFEGTCPWICLTAVAKDGNNNLFPVAWAIVETENAETWEWFIELLVTYLGNVGQDVTWKRQGVEPVTFMSDRQKGLLEAFNKVIPRDEIRFSCRHIWAKFKLKFPSQLYKQYFYMAARSTTKFHFNQQMEAIKVLSVDAFNYLNNIPACHWSRHAFSSRCKSGMLPNNCCESFNNVIREARSMPILGMLEWIRRWLMRRCCAKRDGLKQFDSLIMPSVVKMLALLSEDTTWRTMCTQHIMLPHMLSHMPPPFTTCLEKNQWPQTTFPEPLPPAFKKLPRRPKGKKRIKEPGEGEEANYVQSQKKQIMCKNCGQFGHYQKTCKNPHVPPPPPPPPPVNKGGRPKKGAP